MSCAGPRHPSGVIGGKTSAAVMFGDLAGKCPASIAKDLTLADLAFVEGKLTYEYLT